MAQSKLKKAAQELQRTFDRETKRKIVSVGVSEDMPNTDLVVMIKSGSDVKDIPDSFNGFSVGIKFFETKSTHKKNTVANGLSVVCLD